MLQEFKKLVYLETVLISIKYQMGGGDTAQ